MTNKYGGVRRLSFAVDTEGSTRRTVPDQIRDQDRLLAILEESCEAAGIDRDACARQGQGDGELLILPPGIVETRVIPSLVRELKRALRRDNGGRTAEHRLRLRAAAAVDNVHMTAGGYAGDGVVATTRLLDSAEFKSAFKARQEPDLAFALWDDLYRSLIHNEYDDQLSPPMFHAVRIAGYDRLAWFHLPGGATGEPERGTSGSGSSVAGVSGAGLPALGGGKPPGASAPPGYRRATYIAAPFIGIGGPRGDDSQPQLPPQGLPWDQPTREPDAGRAPGSGGQGTGTADRFGQEGGLPADTSPDPDPDPDPYFDPYDNETGTQES
ncbi:hypothetical protein GCM10011583_16130 [Streptomyces camponoticapitis]|uniref:Uncharacterized protein n=1 Tax=Streptomyces camponoticapitis TaxID=1616125 RepID=A0ABQ2E1F5_9ACTN|nr:hypothetical protein [Streptomyces camponoticapitis]GGJ85268.1 hypothetical protein GCM10011583_16130 [Streptomyces camponoticapitis]